MDEVAAKVEALKDEMVKNRRFFHSHPETGFFTFFTTAKIASELKKLGYSLKMGREIMKPEARAGLGSEKDKEKYNKKIIKSLKKITKKIALAEFFPYHSISYNGMYDKLGKGTSPNSNRKIKDYLPTQKFLFEKIKKRIDDKNDEVIIILTRSFAKWYEAIEGLRDYKHCYEVNNTRNFSLNPAQIYKVHRDSVEDELKGIILK